MEMVLAFVIMLACVGAMAIGVIMGRKPITGSCGGLANLGINGECEICGGNPNACPSDQTDAKQIKELGVYPAATDKSRLDA